MKAQSRMQTAVEPAQARNEPQRARAGRRSRVREGGAVSDPDARRRAYSAAIRRITEQADFLPLWSYSTTYAFSRQLEFRPWPDELPRFYLSSWK